MHSNNEVDNIIPLLKPAFQLISVKETHYLIVQNLHQITCPEYLGLASGSPPLLRILFGCGLDHTLKNTKSEPTLF